MHEFVAFSEGPAILVADPTVAAGLPDGTFDDPLFEMEWGANAFVLIGDPAAVHAGLLLADEDVPPGLEPFEGMLLGPGLLRVGRGGVAIAGSEMFDSLDPLEVETTECAPGLYAVKCWRVGASVAPAKSTVPDVRGWIGVGLMGGGLVGFFGTLVTGIAAFTHGTPSSWPLALAGGGVALLAAGFRLTSDGPPHGPRRPELMIRLEPMEEERPVPPGNYLVLD